MIKAFHLTDGRFSLRSKLPLVAEDAPTSWVQIAKEGSWKGHAAGEFELTNDTFSEMLDNFEKQENPVPVTYEHPRHHGDGSPIPAAGWIHELEVRGEKLYALVEWVEDAASLIKKGAYRFCSIVFGPSVDRETGDECGVELFELGITNEPFIDGMEPMRLSARARKNPTTTRRLSTMKFDKALIADAIANLPDDASAEQIHKAVEGALLIQEAGEPEAKEEKPEMEPEAELAKDPVSCSDVPVEMAEAPKDEAGPSADLLLGALKDALPGMDDAAILAFVSDNKDAIAKLAGKQPEEGMPAEESKPTAMSDVRAEVAEAKLLELSRRLAVFEEKELEAKSVRVETLVSEAVEKGTILASHKETFLKLGRADESELRVELSRLGGTPAVPTGKLVTSKNVETSVLEPQDDAERMIVRLLRNQGESVIKRALGDKRSKEAAKLNGRA